MASKRQASSKQPDSREKKAKGEEEDDTWSSTLAALKTAPKEKPPATIDGLCPLSTAPDARVRAGLRCPEGQGWEGVSGRVGGSPRTAPALLTQGQPQFSLQTPMCSLWDISALSPSPNATQVPAQAMSLAVDL